MFGPAKHDFWPILIPATSLLLHLYDKTVARFLLYYLRSFLLFFATFILIDKKPGSARVGTPKTALLTPETSFFTVIYGVFWHGVFLAFLSVFCQPSFFTIFKPQKYQNNI